MRKTKSLPAACVWGSLIFMAGCDSVPFPGGMTGDADEFLRVGISSFEGERALLVGDRAKTLKSTNVSLPLDLLSGASGDAVLVVSGLDVVAGDNGRFARRVAAHPRRVTVRFRVSPGDTDSCVVGSLIGPMDVTTLDGVAAPGKASLPLPSEAKSIVRSGRFSLCAEAEGDFDGLVSVGRVELEFGASMAKKDEVKLCHVSSGDSAGDQTIHVASSAVDAHLGHGDTLGECDSDHDSGDDSSEDDDSGDDDSHDDDSNHHDSDHDDGGHDDGGHGDGDDDDDDSGDGGDSDDDAGSGPVDTDGDGVADGTDACPGTGFGEIVDANGCSCSQLDGDGDGVDDCTDACPNSPSGSVVGSDGCPPAAVDSDGDGVVDGADLCPGTPVGEAVDATGCSCSQTDQDNDGVNDCDDFCPDSAAGAVVDATGCPATVASAGADITVTQVGCVTLTGSAVGGTPPYTFAWTAPGWAGSSAQNPNVVPTETTVYTLTVTDMSFPPQTATDTVTVTFAASAAPVYTIVDIGSLSSQSSFPAGINDSGQVVGFYFTDSSVKRAFLYDAGVMTDLGTLGGAGSNATAINNAGQVVGEAQTTGGDWHAFLWDATNGMIDLGTLGGTSSIANAINNQGSVAGSSQTGTATHAFVYQGGVMTDIDVANSVFSEAYGLNDATTAVGMYISALDEPTALVHDGVGAIPLSPTLFASNRVWAVNNSGVLAGHSWAPGVFRSFLHVCGETIDLGVIPGFTQSSVWAINDSGQMVGSASTAVDTLLNPFVYTGGNIYNLNDLVPSAVDWEFLTAAFGINASGQITGYGRIGGQFRGFILTPAP